MSDTTPENTGAKPQSKPSMGECCRAVLAKLDDGRGITIFECTVCRGLYRLKDPAQRCCGKTSRCQDCGQLAEYPYVMRCNACKNLHLIRKWNVAPVAVATEPITWEFDEYGDVDQFWDALYEQAEDLAEAESRALCEADFQHALEQLRPHNTEPVRIRVGNLYEHLTDDVLPDECDELPEPLETVVQSAISSIEAVGKTVAVSYQPAATRPAEICEQVAEFARKCVRSATRNDAEPK